jgi:hypothetical protein
VPYTDPSEAFIDGTPVDDNGNPLKDVLIPEDDARDLPLDAESARVAAQHKKVMGHKTAGASEVRWNAEPAIRYMQATRLHPNAYVRFKQVEPFENDNIQDRPVSLLSTYDALITYLRESHWRGDKAAYKWTVYDDTQPQWAVGVVKFRSEQEEDEMSRRGQNPYGPPPPQQQPPPHGYPPPYGAPPVPYGYPPPHYVQQPAQYQPPPPQYGPPPQQQPQPPPQQQPPPQIVLPPIPPGLDPTVGALLHGLMQQLAEANRQNAELRSAYQYPPPYAYPPPQQPQVQLPPPEPPPPPKSAIEQLTEMSSLVNHVANFSKGLQRQFAPMDEQQATAVPSDPDFPVKMKDLGPVRLIATPDGRVSAPALYNLDKYQGMADGFLDKVGNFLDKMQSKSTENMREKVQLMERAVAATERKNAFEHQGSRPAFQPPPPSQQQPQQYVSPPPPQQQYVHPWDQFKQRDLDPYGSRDKQPQRDLDPYGNRDTHLGHSNSAPTEAEPTPAPPPAPTAVPEPPQAEEPTVEEANPPA